MRQITTKRTKRRRTVRRRAIRRRGAATIDYFLTIGGVLPMATLAIWAGPRIMNLVFEMTSVLVSWPFP